MKILGAILAFVAVSVGLRAQTNVTINNATKQLQPSSSTIVVGNGQTISTTGTGQIIPRQDAIGVATTATAASTTTLTAASVTLQIFTGSTTQTVQLPSANALGANVSVRYVVINNSSGDVTIQRAGSNLIVSGVAPSGAATYPLSGGSLMIATFASDGNTKWYVF